MALKSRRKGHFNFLFPKSRINWSESKCEMWSQSLINQICKSENCTFEWFSKGVDKRSKLRNCSTNKRLKQKTLLAKDLKTLYLRHYEEIPIYACFPWLLQAGHIYVEPIGVPVLRLPHFRYFLGTHNLGEQEQAPFNEVGQVPWAPPPSSFPFT